MVLTRLYFHHTHPHMHHTAHIPFHTLVTILQARSSFYFNKQSDIKMANNWLYWSVYWCFYKMSFISLKNKCENKSSVSFIKEKNFVSPSEKVNPINSKTVCKQGHLAVPGNCKLSEVSTTLNLVLIQDSIKYSQRKINRKKNSFYKCIVQM